VHKTRRSATLDLPEEYKTKLFESFGVAKRDWATVPDALLKKTKVLAKYLKISH
jgi:hypothetical protein